MIFRQFFEAESSTYTYLLACPDTGQAVFIDPVVETLDRDLAVFASPPERQRMFEGMKCALKPGGILILQGYRPEQIEYGTGGPKRRENMYDEPLLRESFADLEILHFASHDDLIDEGPGHSGMSALIDMVARQRSAPPR